MEKIDLVIVLLAAVAVVGSVAGLATYRPSVQTFDVTFEEVDLGELATGDTTARGLGQAPPIDLEVDPADARNLTTVTIEVEASTDDPLVQQRTLNVEIEGPDGHSDSFELTFEPAVSGTQTEGDDATFEISMLPEAFSRSAATLDEARADVTADHAHTNGTGTWTVTVTVEGDPQGVEADFNVTATLTATAFEADITGRVPGAPIA